MVHATNNEKNSFINCIAIAKRASVEVVDLPSPYLAIFIIGHVRYINILTWLRGFQDKLLNLALFSSYPSLFWELRDKRNLKRIAILTRKPRSHARILSREEDDYVRDIGKHNLCSVLGLHPLLSNVNREAITNISKIQLVVYHQCCVLIG